MEKLNFTPFPVINTERLILRQLDKNDVIQIYFMYPTQGHILDAKTFKCYNKARIKLIKKRGAKRWVKRTTHMEYPKTI